MIYRVLALMQANKITAKQLTDDLELSNSSITDWKKGKAKPSADAIIKLSRYFHVSTDYLLLGEEFSLPPRDHQLLEAYKAVDEGTRRAVDKLLDL